MDENGSCDEHEIFILFILHPNYMIASYRRLLLSERSVNRDSVPNLPKWELRLRSDHKPIPWCGFRERFRLECAERNGGWPSVCTVEGESTLRELLREIVRFLQTQSVTEFDGCSTGAGIQDLRECGNERKVFESDGMGRNGIQILQLKVFHHVSKREREPEKRRDRIQLQPAPIQATGR